MKLHELITAVKEKNLSKDQLEDYRDQMSHLYAEMQLELADIEKEKALFFDSFYTVPVILRDVGGDTHSKMRETGVTDISIKRQWQSTAKGLREIVLKRYCLATKELLNSLKSRLYSIY